MAKSHDYAWLEKHLAPLINKKVTGIVVEAGSEEEFGQPIYGLKFSGGTIVFVLADPEGNGPGHLDIVQEN